MLVLTKTHDTKEKRFSLEDLISNCEQLRSCRTMCSQSLYFVTSISNFILLTLNSISLFFNLILIFMYYSMMETSILSEYRLKNSALPIENSISRSSHQRCSIKKKWQKQPFTGVRENSCSEKFCKIHKKALKMKTFF